MIFRPRPYQELAYDHIVRLKRCNLWAEMGMGKTASGLLAVDALRCIEGLGRVLVLAPKRVCLTVWPEEIQKWDNFRHLDVAVAVGTTKDRRAALASDAPILALNYDNVPWLIKELRGAWPFKMVIADESSKLKAHDSSRFNGKPKRKNRLEDGSLVVIPSEEGLRHYAGKTRRWLNMTGSPATNGLHGLWSQTYLLDGGRRLGANIIAFREEWFRPRRNFHGWDPVSRAKDEIIGKVADLTLTLRSEDWFKDLPPKVENIIRMPLPESARAIYRTLHREFVVAVKGKQITAANAGVLTGKLQQVTSGFVYTEGKAFEEIHDEKILALEEVLEETPSPVLVAYQFQASLARLKAAFPEARVLDTNPRTIADWNAGKIPILLAHPDSAGHGLNLQHGGHVIVYFDLDWDLETHEQILERIGPVRQIQAGYNRPVFVHYLVCPQTVDEIILDALANKASIQNSIKNLTKVCP